MRTRSLYEVSLDRRDTAAKWERRTSNVMLVAVVAMCLVMAGV